MYRKKTEVTYQKWKKMAKEDVQWTCISFDPYSSDLASNPDAGFGEPRSGCRLWWTWIWIQALRNMNPDAGIGEPESGCRLLWLCTRIKAVINLNSDAVFDEHESRYKHWRIWIQMHVWCIWIWMQASGNLITDKYFR